MQKELSQYKVADLFEGNKAVISITEEQTIGEAFLLLKTHNILSLLVTDNDKKPIGFLDVIDLVVSLMVAGISFKVIEAIGCYSLEECTENEKLGFASISTKEIIGKNKQITMKYLRKSKKYLIRRI